MAGQPAVAGGVAAAEKDQQLLLEGEIYNMVSPTRARAPPSPSPPPAAAAGGAVPRPNPWVRAPAFL